MHCATQGAVTRTSPRPENLVGAARKAGVADIVYVSIISIDRIPLPYFKTKLRVERALEASRVGHTVARHPVPRPDQEDLLDPAVLPLLCALGGLLPALDTRDVTFGSSDSSTAHRPAVRRYRRPLRPRAPSWRASILLPRRPAPRRRGTGSGAHRRRLRTRSNLAPDNPVRTIGCATISPKSHRVCLALCFAMTGDRQFGQPPCMCQRSS